MFSLQCINVTAIRVAFCRICLLSGTNSVSFKTVRKHWTPPQFISTNAIAKKKNPQKLTLNKNEDKRGLKLFLINCEIYKLLKNILETFAELLRYKAVIYYFCQMMAHDHITLPTSALPVQIEIMRGGVFWLIHFSVKGTCLMKFWRKSKCNNDVENG